MALGSNSEGLKLIDAHVTELTGHFEAVRQQLDHLDAMNGQLREVALGLSLSASTVAPVIRNAVLVERRRRAAPATA